MLNLEPTTWLFTRFGTNSPHWRLPPDSNALHLWGSDGLGEAVVALTESQAATIRGLTGSIGMLSLDTHIEGMALTLALVGGRTDRDEWAGVAANYRDTEAVVRQMSQGLDFAEQIISEVSSLIVIVDMKGNIKRFNRECERLSGKKEAEVIGESALDLFFPPEEASQIRDNLATFFDRMETWETERQTLTRQGPRTIWWRNRLVRNGTVDQWILVCSGTDVTQMREAQSRLKRMATTDGLTGLPNRHAVHEYINGLVEEMPGQAFDLLFLDLDNFKKINDHYGHAVGDMLIRKTAELLLECISGDDMVARLGGDEFLLLLKNGSPAQTEMLCQHIHERMEAPFTLDRVQAYSSCTIGIARYPEHGADLDALLRNADTAMYAAKENRRGSHRIFTPDMNKRVEESVWLDARLRQSWKRNQLRLYYQPKVCLQSGKVGSVEALVRWQAPDRGLMLPDRFIPYAEESGMIIPIGRWVWREALQQARVWKDQGRSLRIAVNLSSRQMADGAFIEGLRRDMVNAGFETCPLDVELTESSLFANETRTSSNLNGLRALGAEIHLDDFGTGFSSLSQLTCLPLDVVKMDRSFVHAVPEDARATALLKSVVAIAQELNFQVVAEGAETAIQADFLREIGVDYAQGFHYASPMSAADLEDWLSTH